MQALRAKTFLDLCHIGGVFELLLRQFGAPPSYVRGLRGSRVNGLGGSPASARQRHFFALRFLPAAACDNFVVLWTLTAPVAG